MKIIMLAKFILFYYIVSYPGGGIFKLPMSHRIEIDPEDIHVTFNDVKGVSNKYFYYHQFFILTNLLAAKI